MLSDISLALLRSSGWNEHRSISVASWTTQLKKEGFTVHSLAIQVLEKFGGLTLRPHKNDLSLFTPEDICFDPVDAASGEFDRIEMWQNMLGVTLTPIGTVMGWVILLLTESGVTYALADRKLYLRGKTFEEALDNLITARKRQEFVAELERSNSANSLFGGDYAPRRE